MSTLKSLYGDKTTITITLASLSDGSARQGAAVDNSSNLYVDALVAGKITTGSGSSTGDYVDLYVAGSVDGGTTYSGDASGSDGAYSGELDNLRFLGRISTDAASTAFEFGPFSIADAFGGRMPKHWTIVVYNDSDSTLSSTAGNHEIHYSGIHYQSV